MINITDEIIAKNKVERFVSRFEDSYYLLACHVALPLVLTPRLVNYLRMEFLRSAGVPWIAEADLLLSNLLSILHNTISNKYGQYNFFILLILEISFPLKLDPNCKIYKKGSQILDKFSIQTILFPAKFIFFKLGKFISNIRIIRFSFLLFSA